MRIVNPPLIAELDLRNVSISCMILYIREMALLLIGIDKQKCSNCLGRLRRRGRQQEVLHSEICEVVYIC